MASYSSYIPAKDADFSLWLQNFSAVGLASPTVYGLSSAEQSAISAAASDFQTKLAIATDPTTRTSVAVAAKDVSRANAEAVVRPIAARISVSVSITDPQKIAIGTTVRAQSAGPIPPPTDSPALALYSLATGTGKFGYSVAGSVGKAKPYGVVGVEVWQHISAAGHTVNPSDATYVGTYTKTPFRLTFPGTDAGKSLSLFARFTTRSGPAGAVQRGPWSEPLQTIVP